jgi:outer membrane protein assembly factor BamB
MLKYAGSLLCMIISLANGRHGLAEWPQWRGPDRNGYVESVPLITSLPEEGLQPVWKLDGFPGGGSGGWSSPVIDDGRVYVYAHTKTKDADADLGPAKYPYIRPEDRSAMSEQEYEEYEVKRRAENERRAKAFRFQQRLVCIQLDTGEVIWDRTSETVYTRFTQSSTPCVSGGRVFVLGPRRTAHCFDAATGKALWQRQLPGEFRDEFFASSFVVVGDTALVSCGPLTALRVDDGSIRWRGDAPETFQSHSSPVIWWAGDIPVAIVNVKGGRTEAYRVADGVKLWELQSGAGNSTPIIAGVRLLTYGASRKSGLTAYRLDPSRPEQKPEEIWRFQRAADSGSTPVVRRDDVFVQGDKRLAKVSLQDGDAIWQTTLRISNPRYTSLVAAGDQVFYAWEGLLAFSADSDRFRSLYDAEIDSSGRLIRGEDLRRELNLNERSERPGGLVEAERLWQREAIRSGTLACSSPALSDGRIVLRLRDAIVCYDLRR